jgi:hypothetical protein
LKNALKNTMQTSAESESHDFALLALLFFATFSPATYGYLDPGSGSAILGVITAALGALWFTIKQFFYSFTGKNSLTNSLVSQTESLVIFSEGEAYWGTFRPLIEELIKQKIPFRYLTIDVDDPALTIESEFMQAKFVSFSASGRHALSNITAPMMIATTPNIGCAGYPLGKSNNVDNLVHIFHHVGDISVYRKHSLDFYDSVILAGDFQKKSIRQLEAKRGLKEKSLVALGLPYLDNLVQQRSASPWRKKSSPTLLIGSSWGGKGCLRSYGTHFIKALAEQGFNLIIRPHPHSAKFEPEFIAQCKQETQSDFVSWDETISPSQAMAEADLLVSDTSSIRFDFAFLYEKPVITLDIPKKELSEFESQDLHQSWYDDASCAIGPVLEKGNIDNLPMMVRRVLLDPDYYAVKEFRALTIENFGHSASPIVHHLKALSQKGNK